MLLIKSLTELFLAADDAATEDANDPAAAADGFDDEEESEDTDVTSPDFLSTPTMDHGRGLGRGFGLAGYEGVVVVVTDVVSD